MMTIITWMPTLFGARWLVPEPCAVSGGIVGVGQPGPAFPETRSTKRQEHNAAEKTQRRRENTTPQRKHNAAEKTSQDKSSKKEDKNVRWLRLGWLSPSALIPQISSRPSTAVDSS